MTLSAGRLRHRIRIELLVPLFDSNGETIQDPQTGEVSNVWQLMGEAWAAIEPLSAREFIQSQAVQSEVMARIIIRRQNFIPTHEMRIVHGVRVYNIEGVLEDKDSGLEYWTLPVSRGISIEGQ
jgi:SPP1 family predicted phage head-tail adaptor